MPESRAALLEHYRRMQRALLTAVDGLTDEQLSEPSLDGWAVKDHLAHLALWDDLRAGEVERISAGQASVWRTEAGQEEALNALVYALRRGLPAAQARWEVEAAGARLLRAIAHASAEGLEPERYGEAGLRSTHQAQHTGWILRWRRERGL